MISRLAIVFILSILQMTNILKVNKNYQSKKILVYYYAFIINFRLNLKHETPVSCLILIYTKNTTLQFYPYQNCNLE